MTARAPLFRPALAILFVLFFLAPSIASGLAGAGTLNTFREGTSVPLRGSDPSSVATLQLPNPSRVVNASVNISTPHNFQFVSLPGPGRGWWSEIPGCATLVADLGPLRGAALTPMELALVAGVDGGNWTATGNSSKPGLLLEFNATALLGPADPSALEALLTLSAKTDALTPAEQKNLTAAIFEMAPNGRTYWRLADLVPDPLDGTRLTAAVVHPPIRQENGSKFVDVLVVPRNTTARGLEVDGLTVRLHRPTDPLAPRVVVSGTGDSIWAYESPSGGIARFGRTTEFVSGATSGQLS